MSREVDIDDPKNADFQTVEYWDKRYAAEAEDADFDWFRKYRDIQHIATVDALRAGKRFATQTL